MRALYFLALKELNLMQTKNTTDYRNYKASSVAWKQIQWQITSSKKKEISESQLQN